MPHPLTALKGGTGADSRQGRNLHAAAVWRRRAGLGPRQPAQLGDLTLVTAQGHARVTGRRPLGAV